MDSVLAEQKDGGIPIVRVQCQQLGAQGVGGHINAGGIPPHRKNTVHPCIRNVPELLPAIGLIDNVLQAIHRNLKYPAAGGKQNIHLNCFRRGLKHCLGVGEQGIKGNHKNLRTFNSIRTDTHASHRDAS